MIVFLIAANQKTLVERGLHARVNSDEIIELRSAANSIEMARKRQASLSPN